MEEMNYTREQLTCIDEIAIRVIAAGMTNASGLVNFSPEERAYMFDQLAMIGYEVADAVVRERNKRKA